MPKSIYQRILDEVLNLKEEVKKMGSGLGALTQALADITAAINAAVAEIGTVVTELGDSEDTQVQALAAKLEAQVTALNAASRRKVPRKSTDESGLACAAAPRASVPMHLVRM